MITFSIIESVVSPCQFVSNSVAIRSFSIFFPEFLAYAVLISADTHFDPSCNQFPWFFTVGTDHLAIYGFSIALIPRIKKQVGCNESLNDNLPNSQKKARGNVRKTAKIIIRASSWGQNSKENLYMPKLQQRSAARQKISGILCKNLPQRVFKPPTLEKENHRAVLLFHILSSIFDIMLRFFSSSLSDIPVSAQCRPEGRSMQTGQSPQRCR